MNNQRKPKAILKDWRAVQKEKDKVILKKWQSKFNQNQNNERKLSNNN